MALFLKQLQRTAEYVLLRIFEKFMCAIPRPVALFIGEIAGLFLYLIKLRYSVAMANMAYLHLWPAPEQKRIIRKAYRTLGRYGADFLRPSTKAPPCTIFGQEILDREFAKGKGIIVLLAHFGNWEMLATVFGKKIKDLNVIAKHMRNRKVDAWLCGKRSLTGVTTIFMESATRGALRVLKRNGMVAILNDQWAGGQGALAPFLGREANTARAVAGLAYNTGCSVVPAYAIIQRDGSYCIKFFEPSSDILPRESSEAFQKASMAQHNEFIGLWIREFPDHWFGWFHKRFRGQVSYM